MATGKTQKQSSDGSALGFEATLWATADKLRGNLDAAEYKHVVLGLIFLKYISDAFEEKHAALQKDKNADPEDRDEYTAENIFWVPPEARWSYLQGRAKDPVIGKLLDNAMIAIERDNPSLKGVLPKEYARPHLDKQRLGEVIDLISSIDLRSTALVSSDADGQPKRPSPRPSPSGRGSEHYRGGFDFAGLVACARELRKKQTPAEDVLWELLRNRRFMNLKFRRQHQIGEYLVDFCCAEAKLVVETDGPIHERDDRRKHDLKRDAYLEALGFHVHRFKNEQVEQRPQEVLEALKRTLDELPTSSTPSPRRPSPAGRGDGGEGHSPAPPDGQIAEDVIGRVYEYFLGQFASAEGKKGGQFYTPRCVVQLLVEMLAPYKGRVFDPCCGSGGMFVQSVEFVKAHANGNGNPPPPGLWRAGGGKAKGDISIFGQESNPTTWRLARMNLAIRSIEGNLGLEPADSFHHDLHKDLKADYILANPPFNMSDWGGDRLREDPRWKFGVPSAGNANYAWVQHFIHHLAPAGVAGFVLANGSMSSNQSGEGEIRKAIIEADLVDCMVALPGQLFYSTQIPVCLWFLARDKKDGKRRKRHGETLFLDARKLGRMIDRVQRELTAEDIQKIAGTYHAWRGDKGAGKYQDIAGFCKSAGIEEVRSHGHVLTPGRYVGAEAAEDDGEPFEQKMKHLTVTLEEQFVESAKLEKAIRQNLKTIGHA